MVDYPLRMIVKKVIIKTLHQSDEKQKALQREKVHEESPRLEKDRDKERDTERNRKIVRAIIQRQ